MRRWALGFVGLLVGACGSIIGVGPLTSNDEQDSGTDSDVPPPPVFDAAPQTIDASAFADAAPDAQCFATAATPPRSVTTSGAGNPWVDLQNMTAEDGKNAVGGGCCSGDTTQTVTAVNFGFDVPVTAQLQGVTIRVKALSDPGGVFHDSSLSLTSEGKAGTDLKNGVSWPGAYESRTYGDPTSLDGLALTPDAVNSPAFGVTLDATKPAFTGGTSTFEVDVLQVTVFYCQ